MNAPSPAPTKVPETVEEFVGNSKLSPDRLLKLIEQWRHLQAGSSHDKCKSGHKTAN